VQSGPMQLSVDLIAHKLHHDLKTDIRIKGTYCTKVASSLFYKQVLVVMYAHRAEIGWVSMMQFNVCRTT
jgi:hypothetical protein